MNILTEIVLPLLSIIGIVAIVNGIYYEIKLRRAKKKYIDSLPKILDAKSKAVCADGHEWLSRNVHLAIPGMGTKSYMVCRDCGYIADTEMVLDQKGLDAAIQMQEERDAEEARVKKANKEIIDALYAEMSMWASRNKLSEDESNALEEYHNFIVDKFTEVANKKRAELAYQEEERQRYENREDIDS